MVAAFANKFMEGSSCNTSMALDGARQRILQTKEGWPGEGVSVIPTLTRTGVGVAHDSGVPGNAKMQQQVRKEIPV